MTTVACPHEQRKFYERARKGKMSFQRWVQMPNGDVEAEFKCTELQPNGDQEVLFTVSWVAETEERLVKNLSARYRVTHPRSFALGARRLSSRQLLVLPPAPAPLALRVAAASPAWLMRICPFFLGTQ